jgi:hypothetical protein
MLLQASIEEYCKVIWSGEQHKNSDLGRKRTLLSGVMTLSVLASKGSEFCIYKIHDDSDDFRVLKQEASTRVWLLVDV